MSKRKTTAQFIQGARKVHGEKYDYKESVYLGAHKKIKIRCAIHGVFEQKPNAHLSGQGCLLCGINKRSKARSLQTPGFIEKAKQKHGDNKYDYGLVDYVNEDTKVKLICFKHGMFEQRPHDHLNGAGCPFCANELKAQQRGKGKSNFILDAKKIHGEKYSYELCDYVNNKVKVQILCPTHGVFLQRPNCHLNGKGCPECADYGFNHQKQALLYFVCVDKITECFWKVGITNTTLERRFSEHRFITHRFEWKIKDGWSAKKIEKAVLKEFACYNLPPDRHRIKRGGFTECFSDAIPWIDVVKLISDLSVDVSV